MSTACFFAVIAAAGIGKRVGAQIPKQYLTVLGKTIIEHSISPFLAHPEIKQVIVCVAKNDRWLQHLPVAVHPKIKIVIGGKERVDSVLCALKQIPLNATVLVHDAARPCIQRADINKLLSHAKRADTGAILACKVRDTMKRSNSLNQIEHTVERQNLWHALTPQMFNNQQLLTAISSIHEKHLITDEASAIELSGGCVTLIEGRSDNLKVTQAEDLLLAEFYLTKLAGL